ASSIAELRPAAQGVHYGTVTTPHHPSESAAPVQQTGSHSLQIPDDWTRRASIRTLSGERRSLQPKSGRFLVWKMPALAATEIGDAGWRLDDIAMNQPPRDGSASSKASALVLRTRK